MKNSLLSGLRNGLGALIVGIDKLTRPTPLERSPEKQAEVEQQLQNMSIYQFTGCPFCVKTRRAMHRLNLPIAYRDAKQSPWREELERGGGKVQVPCLRIDEDGETRWMYESSDINQYMEERFG
ncbi:MAG: glutaredoxin [Gammaproteobacteria bacterium]|nr:MAG: glutaredoxin [Gammaproteobacteria bacterium]